MARVASAQTQVDIVRLEARTAPVRGLPVWTVAGQMQAPAMVGISDLTSLSVGLQLELCP